MSIDIILTAEKAKEARKMFQLAVSLNKNNQPSNRYDPVHNPILYVVGSSNTIKMDLQAGTLVNEEQEIHVVFNYDDYLNLKEARYSVKAIENHMMSTVPEVLKRIREESISHAKNEEDETYDEVEHYLEDEEDTLYFEQEEDEHRINYPRHEWLD